jgi:hypothetical protein
MPVQAKRSTIGWMSALALTEPRPRLRLVARSHTNGVPAPRQRSFADPAFESLSAAWQRALDAAERALVAARDELPSSYLQERRRALMAERGATAALLNGYLATTHHTWYTYSV